MDKLTHVYTVYSNMAGYMPDNTDPAIYEDLDSAIEGVIDELHNQQEGYDLWNFNISYRDRPTEDDFNQDYDSFLCYILDASPHLDICIHIGYIPVSELNKYERQDLGLDYLDD